MAFKTSPPKASVPNSPEKVLLELPRRKIPGVLLHQGEVLQRYAADAVNAPDVALQLPTGSGKTLVGLLIAEWRRRKFGERAVYLCPTRQLVNQVTEQATEQYGLSVTPFTGSIPGYSPEAKASYQSADRIAVTTYSSLFNTNPYFSNAQLIIVDDAHAADNYITANWSVRVERANKDHTALHAALANLLRPKIGKLNHARLVGDWKGPNDASWVDKLATPHFFDISHELGAIFDAHVGNLQLRYPWSLIRDHLLACQMYLTSNEILIRPLLAPTWSHQAFTVAKQRIFVSATLGEGGDLERLTGRKTIQRLPVPDGWDRQGIGRRFFIFPGMSLRGEDVANLQLHLMSIAGRSVLLAPTLDDAEAIESVVEEKLGFKTFSADEIEESKKPFVQEPKAVAVIANRYDGIDFPNDDCRLLFIEGLPAAMNAQERFIMASMGARVLYNDRIQTRVVQAIGRCTRAPQDYSAVVVAGDELSDYLADKERRRYLHPELQAELEFGTEQSRGTNANDFVENFKIFLANKEAWESANEDILAKRDAAVRESFPARENLREAVGAEIDFQTALWQSDYEKALGSAEQVLGTLQHPDLKGYRALWHYLAASAAWLGARSGNSALAPKADLHFATAKKAAPGISWLAPLTVAQQADATAKETPDAVIEQATKIELVLEKLGVSQDHKFSVREKEILEGLQTPATFEQAHKLLGELLGYEAGKVEVDASPDPWWICGKYCVVFEDHVDGDPNGELGAGKARQTAGHPNWMQKNVPMPDGVEILPVLITSRSKAAEGAKPHLEEFSIWPLNDFLKWATTAVGVVRKVRTTFTAVGDLDWRLQAANELEKNGVDVCSLVALLRAQRGDKIL